MSDKPLVDKARAASGNWSAAVPKFDETDKDRDTQLRRFQKAARELECDDDPQRFDERLRRLATSRSSPDKDA